MEIIDIDEDSPYLDALVELSKANSTTLGFVPYGAFRQHARRRQVLMARDEANNLIGYLLYATAYTKLATSIVHLCVEYPCAHRRLLFFRRLQRDCHKWSSACPHGNSDSVHACSTGRGGRQAFQSAGESRDFRMKVNDNQSPALAALRDTLLPKLAFGELRVMDVRKIIEGSA